MKRFLLFDHDGVLVDTESWYFRAGERALAEVGVRLDEDQYRYDMTHGLGTWGRARRQGVPDEVVDRLRVLRDRYYQEYLRTEPIEIDGVVEVLDALSERVRMAIVTTAKRVDFDLIHEHRRITRRMEFVLTREDYQHAKPDPEPYLLALQRFGAVPEEALVVEDSPRGLASAVAAGVECAVVANRFMDGLDFSGATYRIDRLAQLQGLIG